jgi:hypothetical protein
MANWLERFFVFGLILRFKFFFLLEGRTIQAIFRSSRWTACVFGTFAAVEKGCSLQRPVFLFLPLLFFLIFFPLSFIFFPFLLFSRPGLAFKGSHFGVGSFLAFLRCDFLHRSFMLAPGLSFPFIFLFRNSEV